MMLSIRGKVSERFGEEEHDTYLKIVCDSDHGGLATGGPVGVALALKKPPATPLVLKVCSSLLRSTNGNLFCAVCFPPSYSVYSQ